MADLAGDDDDDDLLANFLESELLSADSDSYEEEDGKGNSKEEEDAPPLKKKRVERAAQIDSGIFSSVPPELFHHIFKFLSSEDLISCVLVCRFMSLAASDETLWRRLYCMRWGPSSSPGNFRASAWKKLYIQRDKEDMVEFVRNTPTEFKEYYIQMQAAKRTQSPHPSQLNDDSLILDKTISDQVSLWKSKRGFDNNNNNNNDDSEELMRGHNCNGNLCTYGKIGDVFICEKTGRVHVCDDTCREVVLDQSSGMLVCTVSGRCFDRWLSPDEESEAEPDQQQAGGGDEAEPFMGSGRFARAYLLGYNCADEKELEATLRFC
ncbi:hypothetical protein LUZ60_007285 [Juncus effusus]|nr:hypothetical protein LUZ60_007285 [Juncus effusus]